jgi:hypothetical protein
MIKLLESQLNALKVHANEIEKMIERNTDESIIKEYYEKNVL